MAAPNRAITDPVPQEAPSPGRHVGLRRAPRVRDSLLPAWRLHRQELILLGLRGDDSQPLALLDPRDRPLFVSRECRRHLEDPRRGEAVERLPRHRDPGTAESRLRDGCRIRRRRRPLRAGSREPGFVVLGIDETAQDLPAEVLPRVWEPGFSTRPDGYGRCYARRALRDKGGQIRPGRAAGGGGLARAEPPRADRAAPAGPGEDT